MLDPNVIALEILNDISDIPVIHNQEEATEVAVQIWEDINTALIKYYTGSVVAIFQASETQPSTPSGDNPGGWGTTIPVSEEVIWVSIGTKNTVTSLIDTWSIPFPIGGTGGGGTVVYDNGFINYYNDTTLGFVNGTRTFSITATGTEYVFYSAYTEYTKTSDSIVISNEEGSHFIYYDSAGVLQETVNPSSGDLYTLIKTYAIVSYIYWDATASQAILGPLREQHGVYMDGDTHVYLHTNFRTRWDSGLALGSILVDQTGNSDSHAQWSTALGVIQDEDLRHSISAISSTAGYPIYYNSGSSAYLRRGTLSTFGVLTTGSGRLAYNNINSGGTGVWGLSEVTNNNFVLYHIFATNDPNNPVISVMGQTEYTTVSNARNGATSELLSLLTSFPAPELKALGTIIFQTSNGYSNAVKARIRSTDTGGTYIDWRKDQVGTLVSPSDHNSLLNLQLAGSGVTYGHVTDTTQTIAGDKTFSGTTTFSGGLSLSSLTLDTLTINTEILPDANDGAILGSSTKGWSDLYLASGANIYFSGTDTSIVHSVVSTDHFLTLNNFTAIYSEGNLLPASNGGASLGSSSYGWSNIYIDSTGGIYFNNDVSLALSNTNTLTLSGGSIIGQVGVVGEIAWFDDYIPFSETFPYFCLSNSDWDINSTNWPDLQPYLYNKTLKIYLSSAWTSDIPATAYAVSSNVVTITFATTAAPLVAALNEDNLAHVARGGSSYTNWRTITVPALGSSVPAGTYTITAINVGSRTISFSYTTANVTATTNFNCQFYPNRIYGSTTTARIFSMSGYSLLAAEESYLNRVYKFGNLRNRDYLQAHKHQVRQGGGSGGSEYALLSKSNGGAPASTYTSVHFGSTYDADGSLGTPRTTNQTLPPAMSLFPYIFGGRYISS